MSYKVTNNIVGHQFCHRNCRSCAVLFSLPCDCVCCQNNPYIDDEAEDEEDDNYTDDDNDDDDAGDEGDDELSDVEDSDDKVMETGAQASDSVESLHLCLDTEGMEETQCKLVFE